MNRSPKSETDWTRVKRENARGAAIPYEPGEGPYDPNDPASVREFFSTAVVRRRGQRGPQKAPTKQKITLRLTREVVAHYRSTGPGWQTRIDETLLKAIKRRRAS